jgi:hypothetical protein
MAANIPFINSLGDVYYLTGMQMFIRSNTLNVFLNGVDSIQDEPPAVHALADKDESLTISASAATQEISVAFNNSMDWADEVGGQMYIYQSTPQKQTINFFKGPYSYLDHIAGGQPGQPPTSPQDFTSLYTIAQNQRIFVQIRFQRADMRLSEVLRVNCVVGA